MPCPAETEQQACLVGLWPAPGYDIVTKQVITMTKANADSVYSNSCYTGTGTSYLCCVFDMMITTMMIMMMMMMMMTMTMMTMMMMMTATTTTTIMMCTLLLMMMMLADADNAVMIRTCEVVT